MSQGTVSLSMHPPTREAIGVVCFSEAAGSVKPSAWVLSTRGCMRGWSGDQSQKLLMAEVT